MVVMSVLRAFVLVSLFVLCACAIGNGEKNITSQDILWIEKGRTTRDQVVTKFGEPAFIGVYKGVGEYSEYTVPQRTTLILQPIQSGPFPQVQRPPIDTTVPQAESPANRFWVIYYAQGIVHDFGFGTPPN